jgi:ribose-phosphate pyrophosphokinase
MKLFLTSSTQHLRRSLINCGCNIGRYESYTFADGERGYRLKENVKRKQVVITASILPSPESLFELMALNRLVSENGAAKTTLIIPYLGYARQDRPGRPGEGSIGIMVADLIRDMKPSRLFTVDVHSNFIREVLDQSVTEISALPLLASALANQRPDVIVSPDAGSLSRAEQLAALLEPHPGVATIDKVRPRPNVAIAKRLHGDVRGKKVLIVDDIIDTGGTLSEGLKLVSQNGAQSICLAATHGIFSGKARERLSRLPVEEILVTNTLPQIRFKKIRVLDIVPLILDALART